ncbi:hypothetical protein PLICRDRAFT_116656 [Plicaturopsis crispa FD-325 SS-3]|uniref:Unplaced genomic scaffold PLICRscaffold_15, whole genome shotgun sequence n=1 Tax=Plicaturopsis crispa FD-325 SS-3 TaxID=944288 RepID=A0A0C9SL78_PLICR|nr:hypothetical protein PLICRDRAFT_116656 [Plicaturopsis crispa FD-325 SS-3]
MVVPEWTLVDFIHRGPWWRNRGILILNLWLILPIMTSSVNGLDSSLMNGLQIIPDWQSYFHYPEGRTLAGLINSAQSIGALTGLFIAPFVSDGYGRRATLFVASIIMLAGVAMQATAPSSDVLIAARILLGFGLAFSVNAAPLLITELAYPTQRGKITSFFNTSWYMGSVLGAWICLGAYDTAEGSIWSWRVPTLVQGLVPVLQLSLVWFLPESPRYLVSKGLESQAARTLARYHANGGDERDPLVVFEMAQIRHALKMEKEISKSTSYLSLLQTSGNRKRVRLIIAIAMFSQWSGNGLVSYYINLVLQGVGIYDPRTKAIINGGLQVFNFVIALTGALLVDRLGRRTLFIISTTGMLIVMLAFTFWTLTTALFNTHHSVAAAKATIPLIFVFYFFYDIAYTPMLVSYTLEILPYNIRAKGFAIMNLTVCMTQAFNQFVNPWALNAIGWKYYLVYCGWLALEICFILAFVVETRGRTLEETAILFDSNHEKQHHDLVQMGGQAATMTMSRADRLQVRAENLECPVKSLEMRPSRASLRRDADSWSEELHSVSGFYVPEDGGEKLHVPISEHSRLQRPSNEDMRQTVSSIGLAL